MWFKQVRDIWCVKVNANSFFSENRYKLNAEPHEKKSFEAFEKWSNYTYVWMMAVNCVNSFVVSDISNYLERLIWHQFHLEHLQSIAWGHLWWLFIACCVILAEENHKNNLRLALLGNNKFTKWTTEPFHFPCCMEIEQQNIREKEGRKCLRQNTRKKQTIFFSLTRFLSLFFISMFANTSRPYKITCPDVDVCRRFIFSINICRHFKDVLRSRTFF